MKRKANKPLDQCSRQYLFNILRKGQGKCPKCGGKPDPRARKSKLCTKHLAYQRDLMRKRTGVKKPHLRVEDWNLLNWRLTNAELSDATGMNPRTISHARAKVMHYRAKGY